MKSWILFTIIFSLIFSPNAFCQPAHTSTNKSKVSIIGQSLIEVEPTSYILEITISETFTNSPGTGLQVVDIYIDSIELILKEKLTTLGFLSKKLKSVSINTSNNNYNSKGDYELLITEVFTYPVRNFEDLIVLMKGLRFNGLQEIKIKKLFDIDNAEIQNRLYSEAFNDAKIKVENLLTSINLKQSEEFNISFVDAIESGLNRYPVCCDINYTEFVRLNEIKRTKTLSATFNFTFEITH